MRTPWLRPRIDLFGPAAAAGLLAALLVWFGPPGTDLAAHAYQRTLFIQHGFVLWNNFWYAGRYSFVNYSVLYYPLAAVIGIRLLAVLTVMLAVIAFSAVVCHEWKLHSRWTIRAFAVVFALLVVSAAYPFMLGMALALLALWSLQQARGWGFACFTLLTLAASPLAFLLLVVLLVGVALARRGEPRKFVAPAAAIAAIAVLEFLMRRMFPGRGSFPFSPEEFLAASAFCLIGVALTWRVAGARMLRSTYVVYFVACTAAFTVSSPVGENIARLRFVAAPLAILTLSLRRWQPRFLCAVALTLALSWNLTPLAASFVHSVNDPAAQAAYWSPTITYLKGHLRPSYRVEAVDTAGHWPANFLARARIPLARGWFRQEDFPRNRVLYGEFGAKPYIAWLRRVSVRYVVLTSARPDYSSRAEARLLRSGSSGLTPVYRTATTTIFQVSSPRPLITAPARVLALGYTSIKLAVPAKGTYRLNVTYAPYWHTRAGCLTETPDGMTELSVRRTGVVTLHFAVTAARALEAMVGTQAEPCG
ncbi:MAG: hypothetical protein M3R37_01620 [Actinomycetota bacterium]|nr:hypothetical protein [Actinomycetota bacterium]